MRMSTPEKKILIISCYYVLLGVVALTAFTQTLKDNEALTREYEKYFLCESKGIDPDDTEACDRSDFEQYQTPGLTASAYFLLGFFPVANLIYAVNVKELKQFFSQFSRDNYLPSTKQTTVSKYE